MNVLVDRIARQFDLREAEMRRCRLRDVHDLAVGAHDEQKAVENLRQLRIHFAFDDRLRGQSRAPHGTQP